MTAAQYLVLRSAKEALIAPVPRRWRLPWRLWVQRRIGFYERELDIVERLAPPDRLAVDVGANAGLYAYTMARHYARVVAVEPNPRLTRDLEACRLAHVSIVHAALSDYAGDGVLSVPVRRGGVPVYGLGSLDPAAAGTPVWRFPVPVQTLDGLALGDVGLIKIDVEGQELRVLNGAARTIAYHRPVALIEVAEKNRAQVRLFFTAHGYGETTTAERFGVRGTPGNLLFWPQ